MSKRAPGQPSFLDSNVTMFSRLGGRLRSVSISHGLMSAAVDVIGSWSRGRLGGSSAACLIFDEGLGLV